VEFTPAPAVVLLENLRNTPCPACVKSTISRGPVTSTSEDFRTSVTNGPTSNFLAQIVFS
jgi:hypothetical protein